jgi:sugar phosphate isomerase/epimerase
MTMTERPGICLGGLLPDPLAPTRETMRAAVEGAASAGFAWSSIWAWQLPLLADDGSIDSARATLDRFGLRPRMVEVASAWAAGASDDEVHAEAESFATTAEAVGASLVLAVCLEPGLSDPARAQERLAALAERVRPAGASVCVEFLPWSGIPRLRDAWELVGPLDDVGLVLDTWHWQRQPGGPDLDALASVPADRVVFLQLSDAPAKPSGSLMEETISARLLPGDGDIDYAPVTQWLSSVGPLVAPEIFNGRLVAERGATPLAAAQYAATLRVTG